MRGEEQHVARGEESDVAGGALARAPRAARRVTPVMKRNFAQPREMTRVLRSPRQSEAMY